MNSKGNILIVDDNVSLLNSCRLWFEEENYNIYTCICAEDAMDVVSKHVIDLLITDYHMPGKNGIELISEVIKARPGMQCIMITEFGNLSTAKKGLRLGIKNYLEKQKELKCFQKDGAIDVHQLQLYVDQCMRKALRINIVKAMNKSLLLWQNRMDKPNIHSYKTDFAEKSGLWQIQNDNGSLRTRGLDRYLTIATLPRNPKKELIINSIRFVLDKHRSVKDEAWHELNVLYCTIEDRIWITL